MTVAATSSTVRGSIVGLHRPNDAGAKHSIIRGTYKGLINYKVGSLWLHKRHAISTKLFSKCSEADGGNFLLLLPYYYYYYYTKKRFRWRNVKRLHSLARTTYKRKKTVTKRECDAK